MKATREDAERTEALLRKGWTRLAAARAAQGFAVEPSDARAVCFCLTGAARAACSTQEAYLDLVRAMAQVVAPGSNVGPEEAVETWNDDIHRTQEEALAVAAKVKEAFA